jgi:UDP-N-acetylglucosamine transferase subunit ALG13
MIFATVGTQLPYDRLIRALDAWAERNPLVDVFAQIGPSAYKPRHMRWARMVGASCFRDHLRACDTVVAHAGMGTIISGVELGKRVIVMPRRAELGEHRNDHQLGTVKRMAHLHGLEVVHQEEELAAALDVEAGGSIDLAGEGDVALHASPQLITEIRCFAGLESR